MTEGTLAKELEQAGVQTYLKISSKGEDEFHNDLQISRENGVLSWHLNEDLIFQADERQILYEHEVAAKLEFVPVGEIGGFSNPQLKDRPDFLYKGQGVNIQD